MMEKARLTQGLSMSMMYSNLFSSTPKEDYLHLLDGGEARPRSVIDFMKFKKLDIAKATGIPSKSIRYDERMPEELKERLRELAVLLNLVAQFFKGDATQTALWFTTLNPMLGNVSPRDMIRFGRYKKLLKFILNARMENHW